MLASRAPAPDPAQDDASRSSWRCARTGPASGRSLTLAPAAEHPLPDRPDPRRHGTAGGRGRARAVPPARGAGPADQQRRSRIQQLPPDPDRLHRRAEAPAGRPPGAVHPAGDDPLGRRHRAGRHPDAPAPGLFAQDRPRRARRRPRRDRGRPGRSASRPTCRPGSDSNVARTPGLPPAISNPTADRVRPASLGRQRLRGDAGWRHSDDRRPSGSSRAIGSMQQPGGRHRRDPRSAIPGRACRPRCWPGRSHPSRPATRPAAARASPSCTV